MAKRKYNVFYAVQIDVEIDEKVLRQVNEEWRKTFYNLKTDEEIVQHLAYNFLFNNAELSQLDGFCDLDDSLAKKVKVGIENEGTYLVKRR